MNLVLKIFCELILVSYNKINIYDRLSYFFTLIATFGPIAFLLKKVDVWFVTNQDFSVGVFICFLINMAVGVAYHLKLKTFSYMEFITKNSLMLLALIVVYTLLEIVRSVLGNNFGSEAFRIVIQVSTLLWPISKACKNIYVLTNKQHPPKFIMEKLYNFEKTGNLSELFEQNKNDQNG
jgi:hypothetical protein